MALNEQMRLEAIKEAEAIDSGKDTRTKKEMLQEQMEGLKTVGKTAVENIPGVGEAILAKDIAGDVSEGNYASAALGTAALGVGFLPAGDILNKPIKAAAKKLRKQDIKDAEELAGNAEKLEQWRKSNKLPESQRQKNIPEAEQAAEDLFQNKIKSREARQKIKEVFPEPKLYTAETMPEMPTVTDVVGSMGKKSEKGILGVKGFDLEPGQRVGARLDIPAYNEYDKWVVSIHDGKVRNGSVVGYGQAIRLKNIEFGSDPKVALDIAKGKRVAKSTGEEKPMGKATIARVFGDYVPEDPYELQQFAKKVLADKDSSWTQVGMNPYRGSYFYDKATGTPVTRADEVIQVGPLVLAKNVTKPKMTELKEMFKPAARTAEGKLRVFNEGGTVMKKQMELFEPVEGAFDEGGLMQEGGTVDPVSGNDVPIGSTQEEVRDDIPAQLSEGEFVFPADVVRYWGLETLMKMRQEAKAGLQLMDKMGQMGNSEEATIPDDIPFDVNDLDMEDDGVLEYAQGGVVQAQAGTFVQPQGFSSIGGYQPSQFANYQSQYTPYTPPPVPSGQPLAQQYTPATQQAVPTINQQAPTFTGFTGVAAPAAGGYDEMKTYVNSAGQEMQIPFKGGSPIYPIPEGYSLKGDAVKTAQTTTTTDTGTKTAQVQDSGGDDSSDPFAGKNTVRLGGEVYKGPSGFVGDGIKTRRTTGEVVGSKQFAVGTTSSATGDLSKTGIFGSIKDTLAGILDQDQRTLTDQFGNSVAMSKGMYDTLVSEKTSNFTNDIINSIFETQKTIEENFGENYSKDLDNRQAKQFAKELGIDYKGQSLAELMVVNKEAFEAEKKAAKERPSQEEQAKAAGEQRKAEALAMAASLPSGYKIDTTGKSAAEIRKEVGQQRTKQKEDQARAEREAAQRRAEAARNYQYYDSSGDYQGPDPFGGTGVSSGTDFGGTGYETSTGEAMVAEGGLINKNKLAQQMKQSGLASKK